MKFKIALLLGANKEESSIRIKDAVMSKSRGCDFEFETYLISQLNDDVIASLKRAGAVIYLDDNDDALKALSSKLGLEVRLELASGKMVVSDIGDSISGGYGQSPKFGREAYDTLHYGELQIERVARAAYELAEKRIRQITLCDFAGDMLTSRLWRKIVADINEDYPFVRVSAEFASKTAAKLNLQPLDYDIILCPYHIGQILTGVLSANRGESATCLFGDTTYALYAPNDGETNELISLMLKHSFDIE